MLVVLLMLLWCGRLLVRRRCSPSVVGLRSWSCVMMGFVGCSGCSLMARSGTSGSFRRCGDVALLRGWFLGLLRGSASCAVLVVCWPVVVLFWRRLVLCGIG